MGKLLGNAGVSKILGVEHTVSPEYAGKDRSIWTTGSADLIVKLKGGEGDVREGDIGVLDWKPSLPRDGERHSSLLQASIYAEAYKQQLRDQGQDDEADRVKWVSVGAYAEGNSQNGGTTSSWQ